MRASSIKHNIIANFAGKAWSTIMSLVFIPFYIKMVGVEAYGLIGIFVSLMALLSILDLGLSSTLSRELARLSTIQDAAQESRDLVRTLEVIYWSVGILIGLGLVALAPIITQHWIKTQGITEETVRQAIMIMGIIVAFQWPASLYDGGLIGLQRQVLLNSVRGAVATVQYGGAVLVLWLISPTVVAFFVWQIFISATQTALLAVCLWTALPRTNGASLFRKQLLVKNWGFAAGMTGLAIVATVLTQMDKIILSKLLTLEMFGLYVLAFNVGNAVSYLVHPISTAMFPKFSQLALEREDANLASLYHKGCQFASVVVLPVATTLAFFSREILILWLRDPQTADKAHTLVSLAVIGTAFNSLMVLPYFLQLAYGWTKLIFYQNVISIILLVPLLFFLVKNYGVIGAPIVWIILNASYLVILIPLMHKRFLRSEMKQWYLTDVGLPFLIVTGTGFVSYIIMPAEAAKYIVFSWISFTALISAIFSAFALPAVRASINISLLRKWTAK